MPLSWYDGNRQIPGSVNEGSDVINEGRNTATQDYRLQHYATFTPFFPVSCTTVSADYTSSGVDKIGYGAAIVAPTVEQLVHQTRTEMAEAVGHAFEAQLQAEHEKWERDAAIKRAEQAEQENALLKEKVEKARTDLSSHQRRTARGTKARQGCRTGAATTRNARI